MEHDNNRGGVWVECGDALCDPNQDPGEVLHIVAASCSFLGSHCDVCELLKPA